MSYLIGELTLIALTVTVVLMVCAAPVVGWAYHSCDVYGEMKGVPTEFKGFECYVTDGGTVLTIDEHKQRLIRLTQ